MAPGDTDPATASLETLSKALGPPQPATPFVVLPGVFSGALRANLVGLWWRDEPRRSGFMWGAEEVIREDVKVREDIVLDEWASGTRRAIWRGVLAQATVVFGIAGRVRLDRQIVARYGRGGHFAAHRDNVFPGTQHRKLAVSINLNDDYEGGELYLHEVGVMVNAPPGAAVVFPASALHRVMPVLGGERFTYLTFLCEDQTP